MPIGLGEIGFSNWQESFQNVEFLPPSAALDASGAVAASAPLPVTVRPQVVSLLPVDPPTPQGAPANPAPPVNPTQLVAVPLLDQSVNMPVLLDNSTIDNAAGAARGEPAPSQSELGATVPILLIAATAAILILVKK